jgi:hypothetical protein
MSQEQQLIRHLKSGKSINPMQALNMYGIFRLAARVHDLQCKGYLVNTTMVKRQGKRFAQYSLSPNNPKTSR